MIAGWVLATAVAVILTYQAVGLVQTQVTQRPPILAAVDEKSSSTLSPDDLPSIPSTVTIPDDLEGRVDAPPGSQPPADSAPDDSSTTTTVPPDNTASTQLDTTSSSSTSTTTPASTPASSSETIASEGGWVTVSCTGNDVRLSSSIPSAGFGQNVQSDGPEEVRVEFEHLSEDDRTYEIRATCDGGVIQHDVHEDD
jgi:cytoskeletal protein RodZ